MEHQRPHLLPATPPTIPDLLKPSEVARRLGVSRTWLYAAAKDGRIRSIRIGDPDGPAALCSGRPRRVDRRGARRVAARRHERRDAAPARRCGLMATGVYPYRLGDGTVRYYRQVPHVERRAAKAPRLSLRTRGGPMAHADDGRGLPRRGPRGARHVRRALRHVARGAPPADRARHLPRLPGPRREAAQAVLRRDEARGGDGE